MLLDVDGHTCGMKTVKVYRLPILVTLRKLLCCCFLRESASECPSPCGFAPDLTTQIGGSTPHACQQHSTRTLELVRHWAWMLESSDVIELLLLMATGMLMMVVAVVPAMKKSSW